ncbi:NAD(P)H-dependent oxidoreductase [Pseudomonas sp. R5(2019)]|uniref:NAD(P)H-dependent oxidoreductase n=1 Tax=Pseudomonas sp. R5(2019) TaxID=2697566 RepID=UPI0014122403|nr:NAD(P)H-dependent oxidoreductase [Pseudomonas sp. R5(2019)]NBA97610.1 flavodoxin family protein [Pseudomonas sp. R5(2019)]
MNVLIVHAHNEPQSFNASMLNLAVDVLSGQGHEVVVSDLYAMKFNPVASADDFGQRANSEHLVYALEQRNGYNTGTLAPDILAELDKIKWADLIILNFPIYWFSMPAIMKGWIDRVFISGFCYGGVRIYDRGGLKGKKAMLAFSLGGQDHMFGPGAVHGDLQTLLQPIQRGVLGYVGLTVLPPFVAFHVPYISEEARHQYLEQYRQHLLTLDERPSLEFPSLDDYDELLHPKVLPACV